MSPDNWATEHCRPVGMGCRYHGRDPDIYVTCWGETIGWYEHKIYYGHTLSRKPDGWLLVVRARDKGGVKWVTLLRRATPQECVLDFNRMLGRRDREPWIKDKF